MQYLRGRLRCRVPRMVPNVEVNLRGLLGLGKSDLSDDKCELNLVPSKLGPSHRCARTKLITPDLICPSTYQLLRNSGGDSGPDLPFDKSASPERLFSSARVSLAEASLSQIYPSDVSGETIPHHTLCKQGDWFSFAKRRAPSPVCIDDNHSCMKHWNSGFFFIDRRAISDAMVWRHLNAAIDDLRPAAGSFNMADVQCLSAHVIKLRDMPEGVLVLSELSRVWKSRVCDLVLRGADRNVFMIFSDDAEVQEEPHLDVRSTLQRLPFYCTPPAAVEAVILDPPPEDLAVGTPSFKIIAKAEASQKRKACTSGAASSHIAKRTRSTLAQSSGSTTHPSLFVGDDDGSDDDDACVEIPFSFCCSDPFLREPRWELHSRGKGVMVNDVVAPSYGVSRPRPSSEPAPSFKDVFGDAIHTDFFPFSAGPYYATYPEGGVAGNCEFTREE
ncbi:hypothetical protein Tco_0403361 [Tanacetum coccineum]